MSHLVGNPEDRVSRVAAHMLYNRNDTGENLSPLLFNLFLNDLTEYFRTNQCPGITIHELDENLFLYLKIFLLLYADDTIIIADSAANLQFALNIYCSYCETWKLHINYTKTKIIIF